MYLWCSIFLLEDADLGLLAFPPVTWGLTFSSTKIFPCCESWYGWYMRKRQSHFFCHNSIHGGFYVASYPGTDKAKTCLALTMEHAVRPWFAIYSEYFKWKMANIAWTPLGPVRTSGVPAAWSRRFVPARAWLLAGAQLLPQSCERGEDSTSSCNPSPTPTCALSPCLGWQPRPWQRSLMHFLPR